MLIYHREFEIKGFIKNHAYKLGIVLSWLLSVAFELSGGRAESMSAAPFIA